MIRECEKCGEALKASPVITSNKIPPKGRVQTPVTRVYCDNCEGFSIIGVPFEQVKHEYITE